MALAPDVLARGLALVRYLYELALQQSRQTGLRRATAVLTFHDAIEMFLTLGLQHHDIYVTSKMYRFADYWAELARAQVYVTLQGTMESLNRVRVNLKHHAVLPAPGAIEAARVHARDFFNENTPIVFNTNFEDISLVAAVSLFVETRDHLEKAGGMMAAVQYDEAVTQIGIAFAALLHEFEQALEGAGSGHLFDPTTRMKLPRVLERRMPLAAHRPLLGGVEPYADEQIREFARDTVSSINELYGAVSVMSLGLDLPRYARFKRLAPKADRTQTGEYLTSRKTKATTLDDCTFCFDFVIDSALRLQEAVTGP